MEKKQPSFRFESKEFEQAKEKIKNECNRITVSNNMPNTAKAEATKMEQEIILQIVDICLTNPNVKCGINQQTISVTYSNGYDVKKFESFHTGELTEFQGYGFMPLTDLVTKIKNLINN